MTSWVRELDRLTRTRQEVIVVTVLVVRGSTPREAGAKMIVSADGIDGSIGGGRLEFDAIARARAMLGTAQESSIERFLLGAMLGQCCGGLAELLFEPVAAGTAWMTQLVQFDAARTPCVLVRPVRDDGTHTMLVSEAGFWGELCDGPATTAAVRTARSLLTSANAQLHCALPLVFEPVGVGVPELLIFGAGHVGRALVGVLAGIPCHITWIDSRRSEFPESTAENVTIRCTAEPQREIERARPGSDYIVMTHSHVLDFELGASILERGDFRFFGLIGSKTKRRSFESRFLRRGIAGEEIDRMQCPIGIRGIGGKNPAAVAISVAAQWLRACEQTSAHRRETREVPV